MRKLDFGRRGICSAFSELIFRGELASFSVNEVSFGSKIFSFAEGSRFT